MTIKSYLIIQIVCRLIILITIFYFIIKYRKKILQYILKPNKRRISYWFDILMIFLVLISYVYFLIDYFMFEYILQMNFFFQ